MAEESPAAAIERHRAELRVLDEDAFLAELNRLPALADDDEIWWDMTVIDDDLATCRFMQELLATPARAIETLNEPEQALARLSRRQREVTVLRYYLAMDVSEIAGVLDVSEGTVKTHMKSILPKLDASDRTHAVMIALKRGILDL